MRIPRLQWNKSTLTHKKNTIGNVIWRCGRESVQFFFVKSNTWIISWRVCWSLKMWVGHIWKVVYLTSGAGWKKNPMHCWTQSRQNFNEDPTQRLRWNCTRTSKEWTKKILEIPHEINSYAVSRCSALIELTSRQRNSLFDSPLQSAGQLYRC